MFPICSKTGITILVDEKYCNISCFNNQVTVLGEKNSPTPIFAHYTGKRSEEWVLLHGGGVLLVIVTLYNSQVSPVVCCV